MVKITNDGCFVPRLDSGCPTSGCSLQDQRCIPSISHTVNIRYFLRAKKPLKSLMIYACRTVIGFARFRCFNIFRRQQCHSEKTEFRKKMFENVKDAKKLTQFWHCPENCWKLLKALKGSLSTLKARLFEHRLHLNCLSDFSMKCF